MDPALPPTYEETVEKENVAWGPANAIWSKVIIRMDERAVESRASGAGRTRTREPPSTEIHVFSQVDPGNRGLFMPSSSHTCTHMHRHAHTRTHTHCHEALQVQKVFQFRVPTVTKPEEKIALLGWAALTSILHLVQTLNMLCCKVPGFDGDSREEQRPTVGNLSLEKWFRNLRLWLLINSPHLGAESQL